MTTRSPAAAPLKALASITLAVAVALPAPLPALARVPAEDAQLPPTEVVIALRTPGSRPSVERRLAALGATSVRAVRGNLLVAQVPRGKASALPAQALSLSGVAAAAPQGRVRALGVPPDDPWYSRVTGQAAYLGDSIANVNSINLEPAWRQAFLGLDHSLNPYRSGVKVAVIDTGVAPYWREDTGRVVPIADYVYSGSAAEDGFGHGTNVASVIGAKSNNGFGIAGAALEATITIESYKVLDDNGYGTTEDTVRAIMDAADRGCRVINCSLGEPVLDPTTGRETPGLRALYEQAVSYATGKGSLVVAAAGNTGDAVMYPAAVTDALAVAAIDSDTGDAATYSCFGPEIDIAAPGNTVATVSATGWVSGRSGTSYAAPQVSGALALLWSLVPALPAATVRDAVLSTAVDYPRLAPDGVDRHFGHGKLDVWAAYRKLMADVPLQSDVTASASAASGFWTTLRWTAASGTGVFYRYGWTGGPEFQTSSTSARVFLDSDGPHTLYVKEFSANRWANSTLATVTVSPATGLPPLSVSRHAGTTRYGTAVAVSKAAFPRAAGADALVVASGENWPDALSAGVLAKAAGGPLLLTPHDSLPIDVRDEIVRLRPKRIYLVGGDAAVSEGVRSRLGALVGRDNVVRIYGANRYATARAVAARVRALLGGGAIRTALVASGEAFPDALSAAPYAAAAGYPILLTRRGSLPGETAAAIRETGVRRSVVVGGAAAVSSAVASKLPGVTRVSGRDRYDTSRRFAAFAVRDGVLSPEDLALSTGRRFPDALSASPMMAARRGVVVLAESLDPATRAFFDARKLQIRALTLLGGPPALAVSFEDALKTRLRTP